ncbi:MAG: hypothetical protein FWG56_04715 [Desulfovibrionaceae bacterium]|nr:hypothetical protein [Desulfovibrionaceae bacterium]
MEAVGRQPVTVAACPEVAGNTQGTERLARLLAVALADLLMPGGQMPAACPPFPLVLLALPQTLNDAAGAKVWDQARQLLASYGFAGVFDNAHCYLFLQGPAGGMRALGSLFAQGRSDKNPTVLAGVDSLVDLQRLCADYAGERLMTRDNSEGWIAGEAAAAVLLHPVADTRAEDDRHWVLHRPCVVKGQAPHLDKAKAPPPQAMAQALDQALQNAGWRGNHVGRLLSDHDGSAWRARIHADARRRAGGGLDAAEWLPAAVTGQVGAATAPLHWALAAWRLKVDARPPNSVMSSVLDDGPWAAAVALERSLRGSR